MIPRIPIKVLNRNKAPSFAETSIVTTSLFRLSFNAWCFPWRMFWIYLSLRCYFLSSSLWWEFSYFRFVTTFLCFLSSLYLRKISCIKSSLKPCLLLYISMISSCKFFSCTGFFQRSLKIRFLIPIFNS